MRPARLLPAVIALGLLIAGCDTGSVPPGGDEAPRLEGEALIDALADGGLVIYLRHTATTAPGVDDYATLGDCDAQRELSEEGRRDATEIGEAFASLDIPVAEVVASPFCRVVETAELAFGETRTDEALLSLATMEREGDEAYDRVFAAGRRLIATPPPTGTNVVLVGQFSNLRPITGIGIDEGATAIFRTDGEGDIELVAQLSPQGWQELAGTG